MLELATVYTLSPSPESTVAVEVLKSGLLGRKKKHTLFFERFSGEMRFVAADPTASRILLTIDAASIVCRDAGLSEKKRHAIGEFARQSLAVKLHPEIQYTSTRIHPKALRGFVVTGDLRIRETVRELKVNMGWNPKRDHEFQLDGDGTMRLSDFGLPRPSGMFGLIQTVDEVTIHLLLWAAATGAR